MTETPTSSGWFEGLESDLEGARDAIEHGSTEAPKDWPALAVDAGFAEKEDDYYDLLHEATLTATRQMVRAAERSDDRQLINCIRAMDDCERVANELAERVAEWAGTKLDGAGTGIDYARELARSERPTPARGDELANHPDQTEDPTDEALVSLAGRVADIADEADHLRRYVERTAPEVAPNLSMLAGPVITARLIALAGGLEALAKKPSGTVQVLGAEDALFAHLRGEAPPPKHGVIFLHEYVANTAPEQRGSAARALAGKLAIAARVDHYSGELKPELEDQLDERIARIRSRTEGNAGAGSPAGDDGRDEDEPTTGDGP